MEERVKSNHKRRTLARRAAAKESQTAQARTSWNRISPRKTREVVNLIRGKSVDAAISILRLCKRKAATPTLKALKSAMANANEVKKLKIDDLYVAECWVEDGPILKRMLPRARGRADRIFKRTSHTVIVLKERTQK